MAVLNSAKAVSRGGETEFGSECGQKAIPALLGLTKQEGMGLG